MYAEKVKKPLNFFKDSVIDTQAIDFWLKHINPLWSVNEPLGVVVSKKIVAQDTASLKIKINRHVQVGQAGQHHPVRIEINGRFYERTYSLTQIDKAHVQLTVKKVATGKVSTWLVDQAKQGDLIHFGVPYGDMQTPEDSGSIVLVAAGSGITPMYSLLQYWAHNKHLVAKSVTLLYWVKQPQDAAFIKQFEELSKKFPKFEVRVLYTQTENPDSRINQADAENIQDIANTIVFACGPSGFVKKAEQVFSGAKLFKGEAFSLSPSNNAATGFAKITLTKSGKTVTIPKGQSILQSLEQQNVTPAFGCRMGVCNKCVCNKAEGATQNLVTGMQNSEPHHQLKICVNSAQSDLIIDL